jgi:hypothetical protein
MNVPDRWTSICFKKGYGWEPYKGAVMTLEEAKRLLESGLILMAQRRGPLRPGGERAPMDVVVKRSQLGVSLGINAVNDALKSAGSTQSSYE